LHFPESIVLIGAHASYPEVESGWIEPGPVISHRAAQQVFRVRHLREKPGPAETQELFHSGCLRNTSVTVGCASTFLDLLCSEAPNTILQLIRGLAEEDMRAAYRLLDRTERGCRHRIVSAHRLEPGKLPSAVARQPRAAPDRVRRVLQPRRGTRQNTAADRFSHQVLAENGLSRTIYLRLASVRAYHLSGSVHVCSILKPASFNKAPSVFRVNL
jgi:hypothetical protein